MDFRIEKDTMGEIKVPNDKYWGAQTERSLENFKIGKGTMPSEVIEGFAYLKKACAIVNNKLGRLDDAKTKAISQACDEILEGKLDGNFPLVVWQTGSGTQSNMNLNEVIANRATEILGSDFRTQKLVHPNDDVNKGQSSNDTYPTAMRIAFVLEIAKQLIPAIDTLYATLDAKAKEFANLVKIGRTHLQDATPLTLGQEFSGYAHMLKASKDQILATIPFLEELAIGGTAVGTGLNSHPDFSPMVSEVLNEITKTKFSFKSHPNKFHGLTSHDAEVFLSGALNGLGSNLMKIANDIRWLASGPRCGIGEINIPENEPGSSIMPGKVNPVIPEVVNQVCYSVIGSDVTVTFACEGGQLQLNVFEPVVAYSLFNSIIMLEKAMKTLADKCIDGITANEKICSDFVYNSIGIVTAFNPYIGYEKSASIAKEALQTGKSVADICLERGYLTKEEIDKILTPANMLNPHMGENK